ncbi:MAG: glycosyltransferase family 39 protein [Acidobacteriota bacterium]
MSRFGRWLLLMMVVAFGCRLGAAVARDALVAPEGRWERAYEIGSVARALVDGRGFSDPFLAETGPTAVVGPVQPWVRATLHRLAGSEEKAWPWTIVFELIVSSLVVGATALLAREVFDERVALVAAAAMAVHPVLVLAASGYQGASGLFALVVPLVVLALLRLETADESVRPRAVATLALLIGLSFWIEPLLVPALGCWWLTLVVRRRWDLVKTGALAGMAGVLLASPWAVRNTVALGEPTYLRSWGGPELWLGALAGPGEPTPIAHHPSRNPGELRRMQEIGEAAYAREKTAATGRLIADDPGRWMASCTWRYGVVWLGRASWWSSVDHPLWSGPASALRGLAHALPAVVGLSGLALAWRRRTGRGAGLLLLVLLAQAIVPAMTHVEARYRQPLESLLVIGVAAVLVWLGDMIAAGRRRQQ